MEPLSPETLHQLIRRELTGQLEAGKIALPRAPEVALEVLRLSANPLVSTRQIARPLQRDPFLAGRLLQLASSAAYARRGPASVPITDAVTRVGIPGVRALLMASALEQSVFSGPRRVLLRSMWERALGTAVAAELLAQQVGVFAEQAFTLGLLADIGRPLLISSVERLRDGDGQPINFDVAWEAVDDTLSRAAGTLLLAEWRLPQEIQEALAEPRSAELVTLLTMASWTATSSVLESRMLARVGLSLGLSEPDAAAVLEKFPAALALLS